MNGRSVRRLGAGLVAACALALAAAVPAIAAHHHATGTTSDGGTWIADVPSNWNGTLLLYSHGYGTLGPQDAPDPNTQTALLNAGYALAGSGYDPNGSLWALGSAVRDQFQTLAAVKKTVLPAPPRAGARLRDLDGRPDQRPRGPAVRRAARRRADDVRHRRGRHQAQQLPARRRVRDQQAAGRRTPPSSSTTPARAMPSPPRSRSTARRRRRRPRRRAVRAWRWRCR